MRVTVRSRNARSWETTSRLPRWPATNRSRSSSRLAAGEGAERLVESAGEADLRARGRGTRGEVGAAEREEPLERVGVLRDALREPRRQRVHLRRRARDARAPLEVGEERLAG